MSSAGSGEVDITGSPAVAVFAALHAALPLGHLQEVSCCCLLLQSFVGRLGSSQQIVSKQACLLDQIMLSCQYVGRVMLDQRCCIFPIFFHGYCRLL